MTGDEINRDEEADEGAEVVPADPSAPASKHVSQSVPLCLCVSVPAEGDSMGRPGVAQGKPHGIWIPPAGVPRLCGCLAHALLCPSTRYLPMYFHYTVHNLGMQYTPYLGRLYDDGDAAREDMGVYPTATTLQLPRRSIHNMGCTNFIILEVGPTG